MGLLRQHSLDQLLDIQKLMGKKDIGEEETDKVKDYYDYHSDTDIDDEVMWDMANEIQKTPLNKNPDMNYITRFGQGNLGECIGDLTDQEYANNYFQHNPLKSKTLDTYEDFGQEVWFNGTSFRNRKKGTFKKFDDSYQHDKSMQKLNESLKVNNEIHIKRFNEF